MTYLAWGREVYWQIHDILDEINAPVAWIKKWSDYIVFLSGSWRRASVNMLSLFNSLGQNLSVLWVYGWVGRKNDHTYIRTQSRWRKNVQLKAMETCDLCQPVNSLKKLYGTVILSCLLTIALKQKMGVLS